MLTTRRSVRTTRLGVALAALVALIGAITAVTVWGNSPAPAPTAGGTDPPPVCRDVTPLTHALWDPGDNGRGGYGDTPSLAAPPSLYDTAWSLQLLLHQDLPVGNVDLNTVEVWLKAGAVDPSKFSRDQDLTPLARIELTTATLKAAHTNSPDATAKTIETYRTGGLYRDGASKTSSWTSTALAVRALGDIGAPVPDEVGSYAAAHTHDLDPALNLKAIGGKGIPILTVLAHSGRIDAASAPRLSQVLQSWAQQEVAAGASAITVGDLFDIHTIADLEHWQLPKVPPAFFRTLMTPTGLYGIGDNTLRGDPQVTFMAIALGAPTTAQTANALARGEVRNGWLADVSAPNVSDTYLALVADRLCHVSSPGGLEPGTVATWISQALSPTSEGTARVSTLAEACWVARTLHIALPADALTAERAFLADSIRRDAAAPAVGFDLAAADACGVQVTSEQVATIRSELSARGTEPLSMQDARGVFLAGSLLSDQKIKKSACAGVAPLGSGGAYKTSSAASSSDLVSTELGSIICGPPSAPVRDGLVASFATPAGYALTAKGTSGDTDVVNVASLTAAVVLDAGVTQTQYLL